MAKRSYICHWCGDPFQKYACQVRSRRRVFCRWEHYVAWMRSPEGIAQASSGRPGVRARISRSVSRALRTPEAKTRLSEAIKGENNPMKEPKVAARVSAALSGRTLSPEVRRKDSIGVGAAHARGVYGKEWRRKLSMAATGERNSAWRGGVSSEPYSPEFSDALKESIRERDGHMCAVCGETGHDVHHIDYDKKNNTPANLVTLCKSCHAKTSSGDRNYWQLYFVSNWLEPAEWWAAPAYAIQ